MPKPDSVFRAPWLYDTPPFMITDKLYYVGSKAVSSHLFDTGEGLLLLDSGYAETVYLMLESIRALNFDPAHIRWIVHTHAHIDHFGGTRLLVEKYGCKTYMPAADMPFMSDAEMAYATELDIVYEPPHDAWFNVDAELKPGDIVRFGDIVMSAHRADGHTPGTMAYVFELPNGMKAGMHGGIGLNTLTGEYSRKHGLGDAWRQAYNATLDRLEALSVDITLGNHPNQTNTFAKAASACAARNPFIDRDEWRRLMALMRERLRELTRDDPV